MARTKMYARYPYGSNHICGLYHIIDNGGRRYLPQVELNSHTTVTSICYVTKLRQTFVNNESEALPELRYTFPLFDGVAVTAYTIEYAGNVLKGIVKQKDDAKQTYTEAVERGETAGLLESLPSGVFGVTLGNVGPKTAILVTIQYIGELKHDAQVDGLRYVLPTAIAPRYGAYPGEINFDNVSDSKGISITVDIDMAGHAIRKLQSPSHAIGMSLGSLSTSTDDAFERSKGSVTLTNSTTELDKDFVLQVLVDDISKPQAIIEKHPNGGTRALMATLTPKFSLPSITPEIIFVADQSGSMGGKKNEDLVAALKVLLKSLPFGVRFNVCGFGSSYRFLFEQASAYNEDNLKEALDYVQTFNAHMGGTNIFEPMQEAFKRRLGDGPMEIMLLTDGETWSEESLFAFINKEVLENKVDARVFTLGIGSDVSHTLVEGVARAGNGFCQYVADEQMDAKLLRMLRAALSPHLKDIQLEVNYDDRDEHQGDEDDYEIIEKLQDCLVLDSKDQASTGGATPADASASFFDPDVDMDTPIKQDKIQRYAHLPAITIPKLFQAPSEIPPLFPYSRSTFYILLESDASQKKAVSITLRAQAPSGPISLTISLTESKAETPFIHQLAARKAVQELEEGRGWLHHAKTADGTAVKEKFKARFDELVEREAVRLGVQYQIAGKWCSFVATQGTNNEAEGLDTFDSASLSTTAEVSLMSVDESVERPRKKRTIPTTRKSTGGKAPRKQLASHAARRSASSSDESHFAAVTTDSIVLSSNSPGTRGAASVASAPMMRSAATPSSSLFGGALRGMVATVTSQEEPTPAPAAHYKSLGEGASPNEVAREIINSQAFQGCWQASEKMFYLLGLKHAQLDHSNINDVEFTKMVVAFFESSLKSEMELWEFVVEKAKQWLVSQGSAM